MGKDPESGTNDTSPAGDWSDGGKVEVQGVGSRVDRYEVLRTGPVRPRTSLEVEDSVHLDQSLELRRRKIDVLESVQCTGQTRSQRSTHSTFIGCTVQGTLRHIVLLLVTMNSQRHRPAQVRVRRANVI